MLSTLKEVTINIGTVTGILTLTGNRNRYPATVFKYTYTNRRSAYLPLASLAAHEERGVVVIGTWLLHCFFLSISLSLPLSFSHSLSIFPSFSRLSFNLSVSFFSPSFSFSFSFHFSFSFFFFIISLFFFFFHFLFLFFFSSSSWLIGALRFARGFKQEVLATSLCGLSVHFASLVVSKKIPATYRNFIFSPQNTPTFEN